MMGSPLAFLQSKIKGRSWNVNLSIESILRRCKTSTRDDRSSGSSTGAHSPTTSTFSKKSIFGKRSPRNLWRGRRESRDDFGNRWSKIYLPGYSRSSTPLPDISPEGAHTNEVEGEEGERENGLHFVNTITGLGYVEMMFEDEIYDARPHKNSPYLHDHTVEHSARRRFSWLSWSSSLHLTLSRPPTRGMNKSS